MRKKYELIKVHERVCVVVSIWS